MTIVAFILIFSIVVIAHEFGHFLLAKKNGIKVVEFSVGMGPTLLHFTKGETKYSLKLLPIGGACMFEGEDGVYSDDKKEKPKGSFQDANVWARISSVVAGPIFNLILAFLLSLIVVGFSGADTPVIVSTMEGYPAEAAGLQGGDLITSINGEKVKLYREVTLMTLVHQGEDLTIGYSRNGEELSSVITPQYDKESGRYYIGIKGGEITQIKGFDLFRYGYYEVRYWLKSTFKSLQMLVQGKVTKDDVAGPIGIAIVIDDAIEATSPYGLPTVLLTMINIAILLSVNLGVLNLLPLPALDGGRLVFLLIEAIRGKPVPQDKEGMVHFIGFVLLMILMVFVVFNDISRLFR